jgi:hypothetical protein
MNGHYATDSREYSRNENVEGEGALSHWFSIVTGIATSVGVPMMKACQRN